jgi:plastocyanin
VWVAASVERPGRFGVVLLVFVAVASACSSGSTSDGGGTTGGYTVTISQYTFSPDPIDVPAGATITFKNMDTLSHTATSEADAGVYDGGQAPGGFTFDTALIPGGATATLTVPASIAAGTVQPYFCNVHTSMMANPNPTIHVVQ